METLNIVLLVVIIILASMAVKGYRKGILEEFLSILALAIGILGLALVAAVISGYLTGQMSDMLIGIVSLLVLVIVVQIARFLISPLKLIVKVPVIHGLNKLSGFVLGGLEGILFVWIVFFLMEKFNFGGYAAVMLTKINENPFLTILYENNCLNQWLIF